MSRFVNKPLAAAIVAAGCAGFAGPRAAELAQSAYKSHLQFLKIDAQQPPPEIKVVFVSEAEMIGLTKFAARGAFLPKREYEHTVQDGRVGVEIHRIQK
jgi:hypothetical protein